MSHLTINTSKRLPDHFHCASFAAKFRAELLKLLAGMGTLR